MNGSGVAGAAGKLQSALEDLGYEVVNVDNAPEDEEITRLFVNEKIVEQAELFVEDIKDIIEISGIVNLITGTAILPALWIMPINYIDAKTINERANAEYYRSGEGRNILDNLKKQKD